MNWWNRLQAAEAKIVARVRAAIFALGVFGSMEAHAWAEGLGWPESEVWLKRIFAVCMIVSLLLRAGQKNDEPVISVPPTPPRGFVLTKLLIPFVVAAFVAFVAKGLLLTPVGGWLVPVLVFGWVTYAVYKALP